MPDFSFDNNMMRSDNLLNQMSDCSGNSSMALLLTWMDLRFMEVILQLLSNLGMGLIINISTLVNRIPKSKADIHLLLIKLVT